MTVSEFAISMYRSDTIKDRVDILCDGTIIYSDRLEFLRYPEEEEKQNRPWFVDEIVEDVVMRVRPHLPEDEPYHITTLIIIKDTRKERGVDL